mgnify:CR=1 FL=1|jgi:hypothetical protein
MNRTLDPDKITATLKTLERRIGERFPGSGLSGVAGVLTRTAEATSAAVVKIARPYVLLRIAVGLLLALFAATLVWLGAQALDLKASRELTSIMQGVDAGVSLLIVFGGAAYYVSTLEARWRNDQALKGLHELRSIVHVIDMHQLTKDPSAVGGPRTTSSPDRSMTPFELQRYLGYCSELLSLASKVAALYAVKLRDPVIVEAVGDIERLTTELSQKIWQKIVLAGDTTADAATGKRASPSPGA